MHHPGALELATLASFGAVALLSLPATRRRPELAPLARGLVLLALVDLARLWTRGGRLDVVLFIAWAGLVVAPALPVLALRPAAPAVALSFLAGAAVALLGALLAPWWTEVLRGSRAAASASTAVVLADRCLRTRARLGLHEVAALVLPASQLADLASVWALPQPARSFWIARVGSLATNVVLGGILLACCRRKPTPSPS